MRPVSPRALLLQQKMPALLVSNLTNIRYITGLTLSSGLLLVTPKHFHLIVDSRYSEAAERAKGTFQVHDIDALAALLKKVPDCGFESDHVTVSRFQIWKKKFTNTKFIRTSGIIEEYRRQKDPDELRILKRCMRMTKELLRRVPSVLRPGITEEKLARQLLAWALEMGAEGLSFDPIVAFGTHTSSPHHRPTARSLQKGHIVQVDVGVKYRGYCGDMSDVYFTEQPSVAEKRIYSVLAEAKLRARKAAKAGVTNHHLDHIARDILRREKIEHAFTHALGHGVGLDVHEGITLSQKAEKLALVKHEVIAIEPGVYFPGKFGMRLEEMVIVE